MIVSLDRLTDPEIKRSLDRAQAITPAVSITERGDGFVRGSVACNGTCGARAFHGDQHDVVLWWNRIATCDCPAVHGCCFHIAALWAHEGGAIPDKPRDCESYGCGKSDLYYWDGQNGHAPQCPRCGDPEDRYERPQSETAKRIAAGALKGNVGPLASGRQARLINPNRPHIHWAKGVVVITRPCGCVAFEVDTTREPGHGRGPLPLSPFEGCPEHVDHMYPPAPDQVRARQEAL